MEEKISQLVKVEADAILHRPFTLKGHKDIVINPITVGQMIGIYPYLLAMEEDGDTKKINDICTNDDFHEALEMSAKYLQIMKDAIEVIVGKGKADELTPDEVLITVTAIVKRIEMKSFLKSITLIQGLSLTNRKG